MIVSTIETIPGREIAESIGIVRGSTVRARNIGRDIFAGFKNIIGGEISEYTKLPAEAELLSGNSTNLTYTLKVRESTFKESK